MANFGMRLGLGLGLAGRAAGSAEFAPDPIAAIPGLVMRFESWHPETFLTAADGPAGNNDAVKTILDRSTGGFNATQSVETQQALWKTGILNGHGALLLDAVDDGYITECPTGSAYTIYGVVNTSVGASLRTINSRDGNKLLSTSRDNYAVFVSEAATIKYNTSAYGGQWVIFVLRINGAASNFRINGDDVTENSGAGADFGRIAIGYPGSSNEPAGGYLASLGVFSRSISTEETDSLEAYLSAQTGITLGS